MTLVRKPDAIPLFHSLNPKIIIKIENFSLELLVKILKLIKNLEHGNHVAHLEFSIHDILYFLSVIIKREKQARKRKKIE